MTVLGLHCCTGFSLVAASRGSIAVHQFLIAVASLVTENGFYCTWASVVVACGLITAVAWAYLLCSMWDLPRPGIKPMSPALAGGFFTTERPEEP